jgi:hypothetical protein
MEINLQDRLNHVISAVLFSEGAIKELLSILTPFETKEARSFISKPPFHIFRLSLSYLLIIEYCKIFEKGKSNQRLSSIYKLVDELNKRTSKIKYDIPENLFDSEILIIFRTYRDKSFAHSDKHKFNTAFKKLGITIDQLERLYQNLIIVSNLINEIASIELEKSYSLPSVLKLNNQTRNFVEHTSIAVDNYWQSKVRAMKANR